MGAYKHQVVNDQAMPSALGSRAIDRDRGLADEILALKFSQVFLPANNKPVI